MVKDVSLYRVMVIFAGITLVGSMFSLVSAQVPPPVPGDFLNDFVSSGSGGLNVPKNLMFGPDGKLYVISFSSDKVKRYDGLTGAYIDTFVAGGSGGLDGPQGLEFGPDGHLYVTSEYTNEVLRYDGSTGSFIDIFASGGGLSNPQEAIFGPDGNLYVSNYFTDDVLRFNGTTGVFIDIFVPSGSGGLDTAQGLEFGPDGNLYVVSENNPKVLRYNGTTGSFIDAFATVGGGSSPKDLAFGPDDNLYVTVNTNDKVKSFDGTTGALINSNYVSTGSGGLSSPQGLVFGPDDHLYATSQNTNEILRYVGPLGITAYCNGIPATIQGTSGDDNIVGTTGDDVIVGLGGNDFIDSRSGNDVICGDLGIDDIYGGPGDDIIDAGEGNNIVHGESGNDTITSGSGNDNIYGGDGHDTIIAGDGNNYIEGNQKDDTIITGSGDDEIYGGDGYDTITAGDGNNYVEGNQRDDMISTGSGNDDIYGGNGNDVIITSGGNNHIHGENGNDVIATGSGDDDIDGNNGDDCINSGSGTDLIDGGSGTNLINTGSCDFPPTITISSPSDGDSFTEGDSITFSGSATDPEDGGISNLIRWISDDDGLIGIGDSITNSSLSLGSHVITASVTDSFGNTDSDSHSITVTVAPADSSPTVSITSPADGDSFTEGDSITFSGSATDPEDGGLSNTIDWKSSIDGHLGTGDSITNSSLSVGTHTITGSVTDSFSNDDSDIHTITIVPVGVDLPPTVSIITPEDGDSFVNGTSITFSGNATDAEDGNISNSISWSSNFFGFIGNGSSITNSSLHVGTHTITASVTDSAGNTESDSVMIEIIEDNTLEQKLAEDEAEEKALVEKIKKQSKEMRDKNELKEKRQVLKEIKKEFRDFKKELKAIEKQKIKDLKEEIKEVIKELKKNPEYDREFKQILKDELKETKLEIKREMSTHQKIIKNKIDSKVHSLLRSDNPDYDAKKLGFDFKNGKTKIVVKLDDDNPELVNHLSSLGKVNVKNDKHVQLTVKVSDLPKINSIKGIDKIRTPFSAVQFYEELSEGVYFINADLVQFAGITGKGIKAAVLDLAFTDNEKISDNVVQVKSFRQGIGYLPIQGTGNEASHGTAVAEIITDVAPDVELYLYSMETDIEFVAAVDEAISQQVDVIAMSAGWPNFPTDGTSHITQKIEEAVENSIVFVVPSGNFANKHWEGDFVDNNFNNWHEYSNSDEGLTITVTEERITEEKPIVSYLMWDVGMGDVADFEMVLVDPLGQIVDYSANEQLTKFDTPFEYIHHIPDTEGTYSIGILSAGDVSEVSKRPNATLEIFSVYDELEHPVPLSSVSVPADAEGAIVVGAVNHLDGKLQPFSSQGPTNNGKLAPHVVGPDGVTTLALGDEPFYGTSATTPYIAGLAALMLESNPDMTPEQILNEIQENTDTSVLSTEDKYDYSSGYGPANAFFLIDDSEVEE